MLKPRFYIDQRSRLPLFRIDSNIDNYFFPFFTAAGIAAKELGKGLTFDSVQWEKIFTGRNSLIMKWLGSEGTLTAYDLKTEKTVTNPENYNTNLVLKRNIKIGDFYVGKILKQNQRVVFSRKNSFLNQKINIVVSAYFSDSMIWDEKNNRVFQENLYLFWKIPEVSSTDIFYISNCQIFLSQNGRYISHLIDFASVGEKLNEIGIFLDQRIQYSAPGESIVLPEVKPVLKWVSSDLVIENDLLFFDEYKMDSQNKLVFKKQLNSKKVYINKFIFEKETGIKSVQFEFEGLTTFNELNLSGYVKNEKNNLVVSRSQDIHYLKNIPVQISPLQKSRQFNDEFWITGNWRAAMRFWFNNWRQDLGLFFNQKASRDEQGVLEKINQTWEHAFSKKIQDGIFSAQQNIPQKVKLSGFQNLAINPFCQLFKEKLHYDLNTKKILPADEKEVNVTLSEFLNLNRYLNNPIQILEFGIYQLKNNKHFYTTVANDISKVLGAGSSKIFPGQKNFRSGLTIINQIFNSTMAWLPDEMFVQKNVVKMSNSFNLAISKEFCLFLKASLPNYKNANINPAFVPFDFFKETAWNPWANIIGTHNLNQSVHFEITDEIDLIKVDSGLSKSKSIDLVSGTGKIPSAKFFAYPTNKKFVIQCLEMKTVGFRNCVVTFRNASGELANYFKFQTQNKFSGNAKDVVTKIYFDWSRDNNISLDSRWKYSFSALDELQIYNQNSILLAKTTAEFEQKISDQIASVLIFPAKNSLVFLQKNLAQKTSINLNPVVLNLKNVFWNIEDQKSFWEIWKNPKNTRKNALLSKIFKKIKCEIKFEYRQIPDIWKPDKLPNLFHFQNRDVAFIKGDGNIWKGDRVTLTDSSPRRTHTSFYTVWGGEIYNKEGGQKVWDFFEMTNGGGLLTNIIWDSNFKFQKERVGSRWRGAQRYNLFQKRETVWKRRWWSHGRGYGSWVENWNKPGPFFFEKQDDTAWWFDLNTDVKWELFFDEKKEAIELKISFENTDIFARNNLQYLFENVQTEIYARVSASLEN